jgi:hypothetical protein
MVITDVCLPAGSSEMKTATLFEMPNGANTHTEERALLDRILASRHFAKSALLSRFLHYICESHLAGTDSSLTEHHIGVQVFGRSVGYECSDDNIVRNYARQLRNRLDEYFRGEGSEEWLRLQVPRGGYKPIFVRAPLPQHVWIEESQLAEQRVMCESLALQSGVPARRAVHRRALFIVACLALTILAAGGLLLVARSHRAVARVSPMHSFWSSVFSADRNTVVVTADSGFGTLQDVLGRQLALADYMNLRLGAPESDDVNPYVAYDLASQRYTSMVDLETAMAISHLPEAVPSRLSVRFARDLRMDDLKDNNVVLLGSDYTNPWAELFEKNLNFQFQGDALTHTWSIVNRHPAPGEAKLYRGERDQASHRTYARIAWTPNLNHTGHVLMLQGLDMAGTQAAAQSLLNSNALADIWQRSNACTSAQSSFEVLLTTTSIGSNAGTFLLLSTRQSC